MKILLPVDGSDYTKRMLAYLATHEEVLGDRHEYVFFTAVMAVTPHVTHFVDHRTIDDYYRSQADDVFKPIAAFAERHRWNFRTRFVAGPAATSIAAAAEEEKVDLIVMGTHGHSALGNVVLGSVASGVLARCKVPVLLVR